MLEVLITLAIIFVPIMVVGTWINVILLAKKYRDTSDNKEKQSRYLAFSDARGKAIVLTLCLIGLVILFSTAMSNM